MFVIVLNSLFGIPRILFEYNFIFRYEFNDTIWQNDDRHGAKHDTINDIEYCWAVDMKYEITFSFLQVIVWSNTPIQIHKSDTCLIIVGVCWSIIVGKNKNNNPDNIPILILNHVMDDGSVWLTTVQLFEQKICRHERILEGLRFYTWILFFSNTNEIN